MTRYRYLLAVGLLFLSIAFGQTASKTGATGTISVTVTGTSASVSFTGSNFGRIDAFLDGAPITISPSNYAATATFTLPPTPSGNHNLVVFETDNIAGYPIASPPSVSVTLTVTSTGAGYPVSVPAFPAHTEALTSSFGHWLGSIFFLDSLTLATDSTLNSYAWPTSGVTTGEQGLFTGVTAGSLAACKSTADIFIGRMAAQSAAKGLRFMIAGDDLARDASITVNGVAYSSNWSAWLHTTWSDGTSLQCLTYTLAEMQANAAIFDGINVVDESDLFMTQTSDADFATLVSYLRTTSIKISFPTHNTSYSDRYSANSDYLQVYLNPESYFTRYAVYNDPGGFVYDGASMPQTWSALKSAVAAIPANKPFVVLSSVAGGSGGFDGWRPAVQANVTWLCLALGCQGVRNYALDNYGWATGRTGPDANGQYSNQIGILLPGDNTCTSGGLGTDQTNRWARMSFNQALIESLMASGKIAGARTLDVSGWGSDIVKVSFSGGAVIAINVSEGTRATPSVSAPAYRITGSQNSNTWTNALAPGEVAVWPNGVGSGIAPTVTSTPLLPSGTAATAYSFQFAASGTAPITWSATGVPSGMTLTPTGLLSGAAAAGTYSIAVTASNGTSPNYSGTFSLMIAPATAPTVYASGVTRQQATVLFAVSDPSQCTVTVFQDSALTLKVDDTNNAVFSGSEACNRAGNVVNGRQVTAVFGLRTSQTANSDGKLHSRSLQVATTYYYRIADTLNSTATTGSFTTANIPWGDTHIEEVPYSATGWNHWAYPDLDWTDAGLSKQYIDPLSGVAFTRAPRELAGLAGPAGNVVNGEFNFNGVLDINSKWTNPANAAPASVPGSPSSGPWASYSGTAQDPIYLPVSLFTNPWPIGSEYAWNIDDLQLNIYGYASSGSGDDTHVLAAICTYYSTVTNTCTTEQDIPLPGSAGKTSVPSSYPAFQLAGWNIGRFLTAGELVNVFGRTSDGNSATVTNSAVVLAGKTYLPPMASVGMPIQIGGTWYHIGTLGTATHFTLMEPGVNITTPSSWILGSFGIRIRKKTTASNQINIAATYGLAYSGTAQMPANGAADFCSSLTFTVSYAADGVTAITPVPNSRLCFVLGDASSNSEAGQLWVLLGTGESRYISPLYHGGGSSPAVALGGFSASDPYTMYAWQDGSFYSVVYSPTCNNFQMWGYSASAPGRAGNAWNIHAIPPAVPDCVTWTSLGSLSSQITAAMTASPNPIWDPSLTNWSFYTAQPGANGHVLADLYLSPSGVQDNACLQAIVDLNASGGPSLIKIFDTFSGSIPYFRWGGCHSYGMDSVRNVDWAPTNIETMYARTYGGNFSGPYYLPPVTAVSTDGSTYNTSNTTLNPGKFIPSPDSRCTLNGTVAPWTYTDPVLGNLCVDLSTDAMPAGGNTPSPNGVAGQCASNPFGVTGPQCAWFKVPTDIPCNDRPGPGSLEYTKNGACPWHATPWGAAQVFLPGDYISRGTSNDGTTLDPWNAGKREKFRILTKTSDGSGGWIMMVQRWAADDNPISSYTSNGGGNGPAVVYFDHLWSFGPEALLVNGWQPYMVPNNGGGPTWVELGNPLASTSIIGDSSPITANHNVIGIGPAGGGQFMRVGASESVIGTIPSGAINAPPTAVMNTDSVPFGGIALGDGGNLEDYPSLSNWTRPSQWGRSVYQNFRHVNPGSGTIPEDLRTMFGQTYTLVSGQSYTYLVTSYQNTGSTAGDFKIRPPNVFSTAGSFKDMSSPALAASGSPLINDSTPWTWCHAYQANECVYGSSVGNVYVSAPNANVGVSGGDACDSDSFRTYTPCVTPLWPNAGWHIEGDATVSDPMGTRFRRISMGLTGPAAQYQYTSPHMVADGSFAIVRAGYVGGVRADSLIYKMPQPGEVDSTDRSNFVPVPVALPAGSGYARVRFGYAENAAPGQFYCMSRQEACLTDATVTPFAFAQTDTLTATDCRNGCTINVPALSGRILYYRVEKSPNGSSGWVNGQTQIQTVK